MSNFVILESLRKHNKTTLIELVEVYLSHLVDVQPEEWERIVAYVKEEEEADKNNDKLSCSKSTSQTKYFTSTNSSTSTDSCKLNNKFAPPKEKELASNIFGNPLSPQSLRQAMILVDFLNEDDNYKLGGIFRKSGTHERQQDLRFMLNNGVRVDLKANRFTAVDVACVLKEFIQKLPEPLLTVYHFELHYELAVTIRAETVEEEIENKNAKRLRIIQLLLHLIPELNRKFFISVMTLLNRVSKASDTTLMDEKNLATIFGQHILCPRSWTPKQVQKSIDIITDAMEFLLINNDKLFTGPTELVLAAKKKLKKIQSAHKKQSNSMNSTGDHISGDEEESDENSTVITFCQRKQPEDTITDQALAELYAQVQAMPETPQKRRYIKQFNRQNGLGTPMHVTSRKGSGMSSKWRSLLPPILRPKH